MSIARRNTFKPPVNPHLLLRAIEVELALRQKRAVQAELARPTHWRERIARIAPRHTAAGFAEWHEQAWEWAWGIQRGVRPPPAVFVCPRGGGKSTTAELITAEVGTGWGTGQPIRNYGWYLSETQDQADDHVQNVAALLEEQGIDRAVGKFGNAKGWRRNRLRTSGGFSLDALGLDVARRGAKLEADRPSLMILDDLDGELDTPETTAKKIAVLSKKLLPAGSSDLAVLAIQNMVTPHGIFAQLVNRTTDILADRVLSGPHPSIRDLTYEQREQPDGSLKFVITGGTPIWAGQDIAACQSFVDTWGLTAFLSECQHDVDDPAGGMFDHLDYRHCRHEDVPLLDRVVVWCDPAVTDSAKSDCNGIQCDGRATDGTIYRLYSWERRASPLETLKQAIRVALEHKAECVGVETDQGGQTWESVYREAWRSLIDEGAVDAATRRPMFRWARAGDGHGPKTHRAGQMLAAYEQGKIVHVYGTHTLLERALRRFPRAKPYDLVDAAYWAWDDLARNPSHDIAEHYKRRAAQLAAAANKE